MLRSASAGCVARTAAASWYLELSTAITITTTAATTTWDDDAAPVLQLAG
jgi:hypothetical protein